MTKKIQMIDIPSGWRYGFPREFDKPENQSYKDWLLEKGVPKEVADGTMLIFSRMWERDA